MTQTKYTQIGPEGVFTVAVERAVILSGGEELRAQHFMLTPGASSGK